MKKNSWGLGESDEKDNAADILQPIKLISSRSTCPKREKRSESRFNRRIHVPLRVELQRV